MSVKLTLEFEDVDEMLAFFSDKNQVLLAESVKKSEPVVEEPKVETIQRECRDCGTNDPGTQWRYPNKEFGPLCNTCGQRYKTRLADAKKKQKVVRAKPEAAKKPKRAKADKKPSWASLHARGLTAKEAADARGTSITAPYVWSSKNGVKWNKPASEVKAKIEVVPQKACTVCNATKTSQWRKRDGKVVCNKCAMRIYRSEKVLEVRARTEKKVQAKVSKPLNWFVERIYAVLKDGLSNSNTVISSDIVGNLKLKGDESEIAMKVCNSMMLHLSKKHKTNFQVVEHGEQIILLSLNYEASLPPLEDFYGG